MSALDDLKRRRNPPTELELCILMAGTLCSPEQAATELARLETQNAEMLHALQRAEQTIRNLAFGFKEKDDYRTIALNEATNLQHDIQRAKGD